MAAEAAKSIIDPIVYPSRPAEAARRRDRLQQFPTSSASDHPGCATSSSISSTFATLMGSSSPSATADRRLSSIPESSTHYRPRPVGGLATPPYRGVSRPALSERGRIFVAAGRASGGRRCHQPATTRRRTGQANRESSKPIRKRQRPGDRDTHNRIRPGGRGIGGASLRPQADGTCTARLTTQALQSEKSSSSSTVAHHRLDRLRNGRRRQRPDVHGRDHRAASSLPRSPWTPESRWPHATPRRPDNFADQYRRGLRRRHRCLDPGAPVVGGSGLGTVDHFDAGASRQTGRAAELSPSAAARPALVGGKINARAACWRHPDHAWACRGTRRGPRSTSAQVRVAHLGCPDACRSRDRRRAARLKSCGAGKQGVENASRGQFASFVAAENRTGRRCRSEAARHQA